LFSESEHYDTSTMTTVDRHVLDLLANSHPFYKKRVIREMEEQVLENTNKFLLTIFHSGVKPSKSFEEALR
jgi:ribosomal protein L31